MKVVSLGSGSSGNALLVEAGPRGRTKLLVDAGLTSRLITTRLRSVGVHPSQLQGILLTHEHSDHVLGVPALVQRFALPVIADPLTYTIVEKNIAAGLWRTDTGKLIPMQSTSDSGPLEEASDVTDADEAAGQASIYEESATLPQSMHLQSVVALPVGSHTTVGDIEVTSFPVSHDAVAPCGYLLSAGGCRVCFVTDSGEVTSAMLDAMRDADLLIVEANHDRQLLLRGPYPYVLKMRILSATGHLSNDQTADAVLRTWRGDSVRWLWLAHLSRTNNRPSLAVESIRTYLQAANANLAQIHISALPPSMGHIWDSTQLWHTPSLWQMDF